MQIDEHRMVITDGRLNGLVCSRCFRRWSELCIGEYVDHVRACSANFVEEYEIAERFGRFRLARIDSWSHLWNYVEAMSELSTEEKESALFVQKGFGTTYVGFLSENKIFGFITFSFDEHPLMKCQVIQDLYIYPSFRNTLKMDELLESAKRIHFSKHEDARSNPDIDIHSMLRPTKTTDSDVGRVLPPSSTSELITCHPCFYASLFQSAKQIAQQSWWRKAFPRLLRKRQVEVHSEMVSEFQERWWNEFKSNGMPMCIDKVPIRERALWELRVEKDMMLDTCDRLRDSAVDREVLIELLDEAREVGAHSAVVADLEAILSTRPVSKQQKRDNIATPTKSIFISYSRDAHGEIANELRDWILETGISPWLDDYDLHAQEIDTKLDDELILDEAIATAIDQSAIVCICVSFETLIRQRYAQREVRYIRYLQDNFLSPKVMLICCDLLPPPSVLSAEAHEVLRHPVDRESFQSLVTGLLGVDPLGITAQKEKVGIVHTPSQCENDHPHPTFFEQNRPEVNYNQANIAQSSYPEISVQVTPSNTAESTEISSKLDSEADPVLPEAGVSQRSVEKGQHRLGEFNKSLESIATRFDQSDDMFFNTGPHQEVEVKSYLYNNIDGAMGAFEEGNYEEVIRVWDPIISHSYFSLCHPAWKNVDKVRSELVFAFKDLFIAHTMIYTSLSFVRSFELLEQIILCPYFSMKGASQYRLNSEKARQSNIAIADSLHYALYWHHNFGKDNIEIVLKYSGENKFQHSMFRLFNHAEARLADIGSVLLGFEDYID